MIARDASISIVQRVQRKIYNAYLGLRSQIAGSDIAYPLFIRIVSLIRPNQISLMASQSSNIVIDGFPRSANTYFVSFFEVAQDAPVSIGRHLHESWQFRFAEKHQIPCVVLIREPAAAVSSALLRDARAEAKTLLKNYVRLYENMLRHRRNSVIAPFELVVEDANQIIRAVNEAYGSRFSLMTDERRNLVADEVTSKDRVAFGSTTLDPTRIAAPSEAKRTASASLRAKMEDHYHDELAEARLTYQKVLRCAVS